MTRLEADIHAVNESVKVISGNVDKLFNIVKQQGEHTADEVQKLMIAITQAAAPKKADMNAVFAGIGVVITIAVLAFTPLWIEVGRGMERDKELRIAIDDHSKQELHPVGKAKIEMLTVQLNEKAAANTAAIRDLDTKLQNEYQLVSAAIKEQVNGMNASSVDRRLQSAKEIAELAHRLEKLEDYTNQAMELHGAQGERLRRIEADILALGIKRVVP